MSFYNLVAGSALAPALVAACLDCAGERPRRAAAVALLWALLLVAGEPLVAIQAGILAAAAVLVATPVGPSRQCRGWSWRSPPGA